GIIPGAGGTQRLSRLVGFQRAKELVYTGRHVSADEAMEIGIGVKLVSSEELLDVAMTDAAEWATKATVAIAAAKRAMNEGWGRPMDDALALEREGFADSFASDDAKEGVDAFVNKRSAKFTGR
ncbi:MAG: enoyl-CoA hydratase/isomerase family protein, partial [Acidimicrobiia bacterium]